MRARCRVLLAVVVPGVLAAGLLSAAEPASATTSGWVDRGYGVGGTLQPRSEISATDAQGRTYLVQINLDQNQVTLSRRTVEGLVDSAWGTDGAVTLAWPGDVVRGLLPQADGSVLVHGLGNGADLLKVTPAGKLDTAFGKDGVLNLPEPADAKANGFPVPLLVRPDGSFVVGDYTVAPDSPTVTTHLLAYTPAGAPLSGFGTAGRLDLPGIQLADLALDGSAVVATGRPLKDDADPNRTVVARVTAAGALDTAFGTGGRVTLKDSVTSTLTRSVVPSVTVRSSRIYLPVQRVWSGGYRRQVGVVRLLAPGGLPDPGFGTTVDGLAGTALAGLENLQSTKNCELRPERVVIASLGALLVSAEHCTEDQPRGAVVVNRFTAEGAADGSFGDRGQITVSEIEGKAVNPFWAVSVGYQPNGKLLIGAGVQGGGYGLVRVNAVAATADGGYVPVEPSRLLDTRNGTGAPAAQVPAGGTVTLQVTGRGGVPANAGAVVLNITGTQNAGGYVTVYPTGSAVPTVSNLNLTAAETRANLVTVKLGTGGKVSLRSGSQKPLHLIGDVVGYYTPTSATRVAGSFHPLAPARLLDTRTGNGAPKGRAQSGRPVALQVTNRGGVPASNVSAVVLNVTAVDPTKAGYLTVYPNTIARPTISTLNFGAGRTVANLTTVPVGTDGKVALALTGTDSDLLADVAGYYVGGTATAPGTFVALTPARAMDTRVALPSGPDKADLGAQPAGPDSFTNLGVLGRTGVPATGVASVVMNVTAVDARAATVVTVRDRWESAQPLYSNLNVTQGATVAGMALPTVGGLGVTFQNGLGTVDLIADVAGYFRS